MFVRIASKVSFTDIPYRRPTRLFPAITGFVYSGADRLRIKFVVSPVKPNENRTTVYVTIIANNTCDLTIITALSPRKLGEHKYNIDQSELLKKSPSRTYDVCRPQGKVFFVRGMTLF